jgi:hypothetical protein
MFQGENKMRTLNLNEVLATNGGRSQAKKINTEKPASMPIFGTSSGRAPSLGGGTGCGSSGGGALVRPPSNEFV